MSTNHRIRLFLVNFAFFFAQNDSFNDNFFSFKSTSTSMSILVEMLVFLLFYLIASFSVPIRIGQKLNTILNPIVFYYAVKNKSSLMSFA